MTDAPFGFDHPDDSPGYLLWQTFITWQRRIKKALEPHGITHAQFVIMAQLLWFESKNLKASQVMLSQWTKLDKMTVSKGLKGLASGGYIQRAEDQEDTRAKTTKLTESGKALIHRLVPIVEDIDSDYFGVILPMEQQNLLSILRRLVSENDATTHELP